MVMWTSSLGGKKVSELGYILGKTNRFVECVGKNEKRNQG